MLITFRACVPLAAHRTHLNSGGKIQKHAAPARFALAHTRHHCATGKRWLALQRPCLPYSNKVATQSCIGGNVWRWALALTRTAASDIKHLLSRVVVQSRWVLGAATRSQVFDATRECAPRHCTKEPFHPKRIPSARMRDRPRLSASCTRQQGTPLACAISMQVSVPHPLAWRAKANSLPSPILDRAKRRSNLRSS